MLANSFRVLKDRPEDLIFLKVARSRELEGDLTFLDSLTII